MNSAIKWGLISGGVSGSWMFIQILFKLYKTNIGLYSGYIFIVLLLFSIYMGIKESRDKEFEGKMLITDALKKGLAVCSVNAIILGLFTYVYWANPNAEFIDYLIERSKELMIKHGDSSAKIEQELDNIRVSLQPMRQVTQTIFGSMILGLFASILFSLLLTRKSFTT